MAPEIAPEAVGSSFSISEIIQPTIEQIREAEQLNTAKKVAEEKLASTLAVRNTNNDGKREVGVKSMESIEDVEGVEKAMEAISLDRRASDLPSPLTIVGRNVQVGTMANLGGRTRSVPANRKIITAVPAPSPLAFRSYKNGTLITNNFLPPDRERKPVHTFSPTEPHNLRVDTANSSSQLQLPAVSINSTQKSSCSQGTLDKLKSLIKTIPRGPTKNSRNTHVEPREPSDGSYHQSYEVELQPIVPRTWIERAQLNKKDILITVDSISHNIHRMKSEYNANGNEIWSVIDDYNPARYDVIEVVKKMTEKQKEVFWMQNWIGITLDFGKPAETVTETEEEALNPLYPITRFKKSVLETLRKFDEDTGIHAYALSVFITIICPLSKDPNQVVKSFTHTQLGSPEFREVVDLAKEMNKFTKINKMEVILMHVPGVRARLTMEQLNYALPFYDCNFEDWSLMWQNEYMTHSEAVHNWPITYLDREMHKVHQQRELLGEGMNGVGDHHQAALSPNTGGGSVDHGIEYHTDRGLRNTRWFKNDARGYTYEHRLEAEEAPKRPLEYYRHP